MTFPKGGICYFCGAPYTRWGHNPEPLANFEQRCCDVCNDTKVIPVRIERAMRRTARNTIRHRGGDILK